MWYRAKSTSSTWINEIRLIDDHLWCCLLDNKIEVRDLDLKLERTILLDDGVQWVWGVAERDEQSVFVATSDGVFLIDKASGRKENSCPIQVVILCTQFMQTCKYYFMGFVRNTNVLDV